MSAVAWARYDGDPQPFTQNKEFNGNYWKLVFLFEKEGLVNPNSGFLSLVKASSEKST